MGLDVELGKSKLLQGEEEVPPKIPRATGSDHRAGINWQVLIGSDVEAVL
jgi:hypothetical protein